MTSVDRGNGALRAETKARKETMTTVDSIQGSSGMMRMQSTGAMGSMPQRPMGGKPPISREEMDAKFRTAAAEQGVDVEKLDGLKEQIQERVHATMEDGGSAEDVQAAIDSVLQDNGIAPDQLKEQMQAAMESLGPPPGRQPEVTSPKGSLDLASMVGSSALLGMDLGRLLSGESQGISVDREA